MTALIIIDLQKDFFHPNGIMRTYHFDYKLIIDDINALVHYFSEKSNCKIIWIRSEYFDKKPNSILTDFINEIKPLISNNSVIITKNYYSAFNGTSRFLFIG